MSWFLKKNRKSAIFEKRLLGSHVVNVFFSFFDSFTNNKKGSRKKEVMLSSRRLAADRLGK